MAFSFSHGSVFSYADETVALDPEQYDDLMSLENFKYDNECRFSPPADLVYIPDFRFDTKWRSIATSQPSHLKLFEPSSNEFQKTNKGVETSNNFEINEKIPYDNTFKAVKQPFLLIATNFITTIPTSCIVQSIESSLSSFPEVSYEMCNDECMVSFLRILYHMMSNIFLILIPFVNF